MLDIVTASKVVGAIASIIASIMVLATWLRPVRILPSCNLVFDGTGPDEIRVTVINKTGKPIYVTSCVSRGAYPKLYTLLGHLRQPFMAPRFYSVIRFGGPTHELLAKDPLKLEPWQPVEFSHRLSEHPLSKFHNKHFLVEVKLSNGRRFRSARLNVPVRWQWSGIK